MLEFECHGKKFLVTVTEGRESNACKGFFFGKEAAFQNDSRVLTRSCFKADIKMDVWEKK